VEEVSLEALIYYPVKTQTYAKALAARVAFYAQEIGKLDEVKALYEKAIQQRNDIEVQKRVGRRQIQPDQVPPNLDQLMDRTILERLQRELALRQQRKSGIEERLAQLAKQEQTQNKLPKQVINLLGVVGSKIRVLQERDKYLENFAMAYADWSETEKKNLTQEAIRRLAESQTRSEYLLWPSSLPNGAKP
jgi:hypothetical protein